MHKQKWTSNNANDYKDNLLHTDKKNKQKTVPCDTVSQNGYSFKTRKATSLGLFQAWCGFRKDCMPSWITWKTPFKGKFTTKLKGHLRQLPAIFVDAKKGKRDNKEEGKGQGEI